MVSPGIVVIRKNRYIPVAKFLSKVRAPLTRALAITRRYQPELNKIIDILLAFTNTDECSCSRRAKFVEAIRDAADAFKVVKPPTGRIWSTLPKSLRPL